MKQVYNTWFLPGYSLIFLLPTCTLSKLKVNDELEQHVNLIYKRIFDKAHSNSSLFSTLEGQIFGGITVSSAQCTNWHNFTIVQRNSEIARLQANFEMGLQFWNCIVQFWNMIIHAWLILSVVEFIFIVSCSISKFLGFREGYSTVLYANLTIP